MEYEFNYFDVLEDDDELIPLVIIMEGIPRALNIRPKYFDTYNNLEFHQRFRFSKETTLFILHLIEDQLEYEHQKNNSVEPILQLLICLRTYATNGFMITMGDYGNMHKSTVSRIVKKVSRAIASLAHVYIKMPTTQQEIMKAQRNFYDIASFPRVIGAIDCTHIRIQSPGGEDAEIFRNRKSYFSLNVQVVSNANREIMDIVARWPGSVHDSTIFNNSNLRARFEGGEFPNCLLLGDSGYPARTYLFTPHLNPVTLSEKLYNESHIRSRVVVEHLFGIWKRLFPILAYGSRIKMNSLLTVIVATAVLHNIIRRRLEDIIPLVSDDERHTMDNIIGENEVPHLQYNDNRPGNMGLIARNALINEYFETLLTNRREQ